MTKKIQGIYVDIDSILDTRLGTLSIMGDDVALRVIKNGYHTRKSDFFKDIDLDQYHSLYRDRDIETLYKSYSTLIPDLLADLIFKIDKIAISEQSNASGKIYINSFPYDSESGIVKTIALFIEKKIGITAEVEVIYLDPTKLTVDYCNHMFDALFMYDYREWMYATINTVTANSHMRDKTLYAPALYYEKEPTQEELDEIKLNSFKSLQMTLSPMVQLEPIDAKAFSVKDITQFKP